MENICPVCGFNKLDTAPYSSKGNSYEFCDVCGFEFGFDDLNSKMSYIEARRVWILEGEEYYPYVLEHSWKEIVFNQLKNVVRIDFSSYPSSLKSINDSWPPVVDWEKVSSLFNKS